MEETTNWKRASIGGLIVTRKEREQLLIDGGRIILEVVEIRGKRVRLALKATTKIRIIMPEKFTKTVPVQKNKTDEKQECFDFTKGSL